MFKYAQLLRKLKQNTSYHFLFVILTSLFLHLFIFMSITQLAEYRPPNNSNRIEVTLEDIEQLKKIHKLQPRLVVESDSRKANEILNEKTKFLSEKTNSVQKETRAKSGKKFVNSESSLTTRAEKKSQLAQQKEAELFRHDFDAYASLKKSNQNTSTKQKFQKSSEASSTNDHLDKIEEDLMTRLNTKEYKYFGYYNRIKVQLNQWWVPKVQQKFTKLFKQGRTLASEENKVTKLVIVLNNAGNLVNVQVLAESGVRDLDDAAIEAFRQAAPFPNPPKGMIDKDGTVKIRWDCVVEG